MIPPNTQKHTEKYKHWDTKSKYTQIHEKGEEIVIKQHQDDSIKYTNTQWQIQTKWCKIQIHEEEDVVAPGGIHQPLLLKNLETLVF